MRQIERAVREAKLLVPVLSENWVQTDWCRREVDLFVRSHEDAGTCIVPIFKNEPPRDRLPEVMQGDNARVGYRFFTQDDKGALNEFYWRGLQDRTAYFVLLRQIAQLIIERLDLRRPIYQNTAAYGHFGRSEPDFTWERTDSADDLAAAAKALA